MKTKLTREEMENIKYLFECAVSACSKQEAMPYINKLQMAGYGLTANANIMYNEMVACTQFAVGRVSEKASRVNNARQLLIKFELFCVE